MRRIPLDAVVSYVIARRPKGPTKQSLRGKPRLLRPAVGRTRNDGHCLFMKPIVKRSVGKYNEISLCAGSLVPNLFNGKRLR